MSRYDANKVNKGIGVRTRRLIAYAVLLFFAFLCLIWFYFLIINATRSRGELTTGFTPIPSTHFLDNMYAVLVKGTLPWILGLFNSLYISFTSSVFCSYFSAMTAYAIHAYDFKIKKFMFTFILMVMTIPTQVTALGFVQLIDKMGMDDSFIPLIIPAMASPIVFFYMKQYLDSSLPLSLVEAARMDGSGEFRTFNSIVIPMMKPALAVQTIFSFVGSWNNYFTPALVLHSNHKKTLPILIATLRGADFMKFDMGHVYFSIAFSIFPVVFVYLLLSKFIVQGVTLGGVKG